jgi:DNA-binding CsgD family transcriptional regulator
VFVTDPEAAIESDEEILKRLFGLTASEARIASLLVQGRDLNEICGKLSIRRTTARTHLRHLFEKLGVRRQGELISLLLRTVGAVRVIQHPK